MEVSFMVQMSTTQQVKIGPITATDCRENVVAVTNLSVTSLDEGVAIVVDDPDSEDNSVFVRAAGVPGTVIVRFIGDALIGDGEVPVVKDIEFRVTDALAGKLLADIGDPAEISEVAIPELDGEVRND